MLVDLSRSGPCADPYQKQLEELRVQTLTPLGSGKRRAIPRFPPRSEDFTWPAPPEATLVKRICFELVIRICFRSGRPRTGISPITACQHLFETKAAAGGGEPASDPEPEVIELFKKMSVPSASAALRSLAGACSS
jgi:hypothetical protein